MKKIITLLTLVFLNVAYSQSGWIEQNSGTTNHLHAVQFINSETGFVVGVGTILKTTNGGANWILTSSGYNSLNDVCFVNSNTGYIVYSYSPEGSILKTTNCGENWNIILSEYFKGFGTIYFINTLTGYVGGVKIGYIPPYYYDIYALIYKTTNGGISWWESYLSKVNDTQCKDLYFIDETGYASTFGPTRVSYLDKTTNGGLNWTHINPPSIEALFFTSKDTGHAVSANGKYYKTTNGGSNWVVNQLSSSALWGMHFPSKDTGYIVGYGPTFYVYKTTNGGLNWIGQGPIAVLSSVFFINNNVGYAVGTGGRIFKTTTGGIPIPPPPLTPILISPTNGSQVTATPLLDWNDETSATSYRLQVSEVSNFMTTVIDKVSLTTSQYQVSGGILSANVQYFWRARARNAGGWSPWASAWNFTTSLIGIHRIVGEIPTVYYLYSNFPNPFNPSTNIKFDIPSSSSVKIVVYNSLGKEEATLVNEKLNTGSYEVSWDGVNYPSGVYFYRLSADGNVVDTKKMLLVK